MKRKILRFSAEHVDSHTFSDTDRLFFDTNIWLYLFLGPKDVDNPLQFDYSSMFRSSINAKSEIFTNILVISEFVNVCARSRSTFSPIGIAHTASEIIRICTFLEKGVSDSQICNMLTAYAEGGVDFNDQVISEICYDEGLILVTHDKGFKHHRGPILTANKKLLRQNTKN